MEIVYRHGCTWRYGFNAKKSGVMVYGESQLEHNRNIGNREFYLGPARVDEKINYDHVGIRSELFSCDASGIEERLSKARRTLNTISGIGVRKNGLSMATCHIMFWTIIVPAALYRSEIWILNDKSIALIEAFQWYACKRLQRFFCKVPNAPSLCAIGWMRLEQFIYVKKMLFIRSILIHNEPTLSKEVFCERARRIFRNPVGHNFDERYSVVSDLLRVANRFGLYEEVKNMVLRDLSYSKQIWNRMVWDKAWRLEDAFWQVEFRIHRSLDILDTMGCGNRYLTWWFISDKFPNLISLYEIMAKRESSKSRRSPFEERDNSEQILPLLRFSSRG